MIDLIADKTTKASMTYDRNQQESDRFPKTREAETNLIFEMRQRQSQRVFRVPDQCQQHAAGAFSVFQN